MLICHALPHFIVLQVSPCTSFNPQSQPHLPVQPFSESRTVPSSPRHTCTSSFLVPSAEVLVLCTNLSIISPKTTFPPQQHCMSYSAPKLELAHPSSFTTHTPSPLAVPFMSPTHARAVCHLLHAQRAPCCLPRGARKWAPLPACRGEDTHCLKANYHGAGDSEKDQANKACLPEGHPKKQCIPVTFIEGVDKLGDMEDGEESIIIKSPTNTQLCSLHSSTYAEKVSGNNYWFLQHTPHHPPLRCWTSPAVPLSYPVSASMSILPTTQPTTTTISPSCGLTLFTAPSQSWFIFTSALLTCQHKCMTM